MRRLLLCNNIQHTFIIVCVTHSQVQNSERPRVGECGSKLHKPASLWCVWCENIRLLFPVSQDFTAACENWGCTNWGCKNTTFLPSLIQGTKVQRRNYTWGSQYGSETTARYGNETTVVLCVLTSTADSKRRDISFLVHLFNLNCFIERRLSVTNLSSENNFSNLSSENNFSELKLVTDNLLSIHAAANWEATQSLTVSKFAPNFSTLWGRASL